nr:uncharacterized protein LOC109166665 [Ipomoea batatas]
MRGAQRLSHSNGCRWGPDGEQAAGTNGSMWRSRFVSGKKAKVVRCELDSSDDDFVAPPLAFLARLQEDSVWKALDGELTAEEDAAFPKIKTRSHAFGKKSKVSQSQPGVSHSCESNDDFVLPPLTFLARLQKYLVWNAPDHELTTKEDAKFPRVKTRAPSAVFVKFI